MENEDKKSKSNFIKRVPIGWWVIGIVFIILIISLFSNSDNSSQTQSTNIQQPTVNTSATTTIKPVAQGNNNISFKKITIKDLVTLNSNGDSLDKNPLIEYEGKVNQEKTYSGTNYIFKIEDGNGYTTLFEMEPKDVGWNKIAIGDTVLIRAIYTTAGSMCPDNSGDVPNLCNDFNVAKNYLPLTLSVSPNPELGNKPTIEIISSSSNLPIISQATSSTSTKQTVQPVVINYNSYPRIQIDQYAKNPPAYLGTGVEVIDGLVSDFLASGDRGGSTNYIEVENVLSPSLDKMEIEIKSNSDYQNIISKLNKNDLINVFGLGAPSGSFTSSMGGNVLIPTVTAQKIEKCSTDCQEANTTFVFSK